MTTLGRVTWDEHLSSEALPLKSGGAAERRNFISTPCGLTSSSLFVGSKRNADPLCGIAQVTEAVQAEGATEVVEVVEVVMFAKLGTEQGRPSPQNMTSPQTHQTACSSALRHQLAQRRRR